MAKRLQGKVIAVSSGGSEDLSKEAADAIEVGFAGIAGDGHAGASREAYAGEREPAGTILRNDRQWSAVSAEELAEISQALDLAEALKAATLGANLCLSGIPELSLLPRGTRFKFPSGAALVVEEYNPPCGDMGAQLALKHRRRDGSRLGDRDWLKPASGRRGLVGMVDVPGAIRVGDAVEVTVFEAPPIRRYPVEG
jgi:MOSC domain-containing protein YiiM